MMNRPSVVLLSLSLGALAFASQGQLLRRELKVGEEVFDVTTDSKASYELPVGKQETKFNLAMEFHVNTTKVENAKGQVDFTVKNMNFSSDGVAVDPGAPKDIKFTAKMDDRNRVSDLANGSQQSNPVSIVTGSVSPAAYFFSDLPEKEVKVGDTWDVDVPAGPEGQGAQASTLKATLKEVTDTGFKVQIVGTIKMLVDGSKIPDGPNKPPADMVWKGSSAVTIDNAYEKSGALISSHQVSKITSTIEVMGQSIPATIEATSDAKRRGNP